jgi:2-hydroxy-3-keto-5-methylthiopentenyl-1-phosphate phosphatase
MKERVILCDFDGTITDNDNIIAIMKAFGPTGWEEIKDDILSEKCSVQEGVGKMFALLETGKRDEITQFAIRNATIRAGFQDLVTYVKEQGWKFYVVSGGIDFFVHPVLEPFKGIDGVYCNGSDFSGEFIKILWPHSCDESCIGGCGCCKPKILRQFDPEKFDRVVIGDSITDLKVAKLANHVFARDFLAEKCEELKLPHVPFHTFYDVIDALKKELPVNLK